MKKMTAAVAVLVVVVAVLAVALWHSNQPVKAAQQDPATDSSSSANVTLSVSAQDTLAGAAAQEYSVDTSAWGYNQDACPFYADLLNGANFMGTTAAQVRLSFNPGQNVRAALENWMSAKDRTSDREEIVQAAYDCSDSVASQLNDQWGRQG